MKGAKWPPKNAAPQKNNDQICVKTDYFLSALLSILFAQLAIGKLLQ
jgi:hypothetical protein